MANIAFSNSDSPPLCGSIFDDVSLPFDSAPFFTENIVMGSLLCIKINSSVNLVNTY